MTVKIIDKYDEHRVFVNVASFYTTAYDYGLLHLTITFKTETMIVSMHAKSAEILEV